MGRFHKRNDMDTNYMDSFGWVVFALVLVFSWFGLLMVKAKQWEKERNKEALEELEREPELPEVDLRAATVVRKGTSLDWEGKVAYPNSRICFLVQFELDYGEKLTLSVDEEHYAAIEEGESGTLAMTNDCFLDFVAGEFPGD